MCGCVIVCIWVNMYVSVRIIMCILADPELHQGGGKFSKRILNFLAFLIIFPKSLCSSWWSSFSHLRVGFRFIQPNFLMIYFTFRRKSGPNSIDKMDRGSWSDKPLWIHHCVSVCVCAYVCVRVCVRVGVRVCVRFRACMCTLPVILNYISLDQIMANDCHTRGWWKTLMDFIFNWTKPPELWWVGYNDCTLSVGD